MRVLHVVVTDAFAGVEQHVARLAQAQAAHGHTVTVLGGDARGTARLAPHVRHEPAASLRAAAAAVRRHARGADVVHVHMTAAELAATLGLAGLRAAPPVVTTRHFAAHRGSGPLGPAVARVAARRVRAQVAISRFVAEHVEGDSTVVPPGLDDAGTPPDAGARSRVVLVVQRLEAEKDTATALRAFAGSGLAAGGWVLRVAGDGAQRDALGRLAADLGLARSVELLGRRDDVADLMRDATVLVAPCPREGLGLSVLEAMRAGLPVVASAAGGHLETAGAVPGAPLFAPGDHAAAARLLFEVATDAAARRRLAAGGRAVVRRATPQAQVAATDAVYRGVLPAAGRRVGGAPGGRSAADAGVTT